MGRSPSRLGLALTGIVLACAAGLGAALGRGWLAGHQTETPVTALVSPPPPVTAPPAGTPAPHDLTPEETPAPAIGPQLNIAVAVVDSLDSPQPRLLAVWIAALHTEQRTAFLLGLSPYLWVSTPDRGELRLRDAFAFDPATGSGGPAFEQALRGVSYAPLMGTVTLDALLLSETVNRLGGVDIGGTRMDGAGAVAYALIGPPPDPLSESARQTELAYALRDAAVISLVDASPYLDLMLERGRSDIAPDALRAVASAFDGYNPANTAIAPPVADPQLVIIAPDGQPAVLLSQDYPLANTAAAGP